MEIGGVVLSQELAIAAGIGAVVGSFLTLFIMDKLLTRLRSSRLKQRKEDFIAIGSHYLLTPISIIQGALAQLQEHESTLSIDQRQQLYAAIFKGQQRLWILAEQFVLVNQIEQGQLRLNLETGNVATAVEGAIAAVDVFAREKNIHLHFEDTTQALREARFDMRYLKQALVAVLDNAIKFSPEGKEVRARLLVEGDFFTVEVVDQGPGMSPEVIRYATQMFGRGTSSYTYDHEGIGLGLYTAAAIVREHGGELRFDTAAGKGTAVFVRFPNR